MIFYSFIVILTSVTVIFFRLKRSYKRLLKDYCLKEKLSDGGPLPKCLIQVSSGRVLDSNKAMKDLFKVFKVFEVSDESPWREFLRLLVIDEETGLEEVRVFGQSWRVSRRGSGFDIEHISLYPIEGENLYNDSIETFSLQEEVKAVLVAGEEEKLKSNVNSIIGEVLKELEVVFDLHGIKVSFSTDPSSKNAVMTFNSKKMKEIVTFFIYSLVAILKDSKSLISFLDIDSKALGSRILINFYISGIEIEEDFFEKGFQTPRKNFSSYSEFWDRVEKVLSPYKGSVNCQRLQATSREGDKINFSLSFEIDRFVSYSPRKEEGKPYLNSPSVNLSSTS